MASLHQIPIPVRVSTRPPAPPKPKAAVLGLAKAIGVARGDLDRDDTLQARGPDYATNLIGIATLLLDPVMALRDVELLMREALAQHVFGSDFHRQSEDDKTLIAEEAHICLLTMTAALAGRGLPLTPWRKQSFILPGEADYIEEAR